MTGEEGSDEESEDEMSTARGELSRVVPTREAEGVHYKKERPLIFRTHKRHLLLHLQIHDNSH